MTIDDIELSRTSPIKARRTENQISDIRNAIYWLLEDDNPMTVRQVFYRLVSMGAIAKTEAEYKGTVCRLLAEMRLAGSLPYGWIADSTRWVRKPRTHSSLEQALQQTARDYRRAVWDNLGVQVEVWSEKDAIAGVLVEETDKWDVPLYVTRGYPSLTYLHEAAAHIISIRKPAYIYYLGDHDPSGLDIARSTEQRLREFAPKSVIYFERVAVTQEQINSLHLLTRPTKKTDTRSRNFAGESVEVDAIPPEQLRTLVRSCINRHVDRHTLAALQATEALEREQFQRVASAFGGRA